MLRRRDAPAWRRQKPSAAARSHASPRLAPSARAVLRAPEAAERCPRGLRAARPEYGPAVVQDCHARWRDRSPAASPPAPLRLTCPNELPWSTPVVSGQLSVARRCPKLASAHNLNTYGIASPTQPKAGWVGHPAGREGFPPYRRW